MGGYTRMKAARELATRLRAYRGEDPIVLAAPNEAILPMAQTIAHSLQGSADLLLVERLELQDSLRSQVGVISETRDLHLDSPAFSMKLTLGALSAAVESGTERLRDRRLQLTGRPQPPDPEGRLVILLTEEIDVPISILLALRSIRRQHPARLVLAGVTVTEDAAARLGSEADDLVFLESRPKAPL